MIAIVRAATSYTWWVTTSPPSDPDAYRRVEEALAERWPEGRIDPTLDRMRALVDVLGHPERTYPVIHVTGTNGKTSTARMIESLLRTLGLRTGRYTSPHLESYTERISIDGQPVSEERFAALYDEVIPFVELVDRDQPIRMSFFEVLTAMAYAAFADAPVDVAVVEVGLGGLWDATNVADGLVSVVTPIALDHERYLGHDLESIAGEKAGIIKPGATAVLADQPLAAAEQLVRHAVEFEATVAREGVEFGVVSREIAVGGQQVELQGLSRRYPEVFIPLHGEHQAHNAATALAAVEAFLGAGPGGISLDLESVQEAFSRVTSPGRLEVVRRSPTIVVDAAHNPAGAQVIAEAIDETFRFQRLVGVVSVMGDKDVRGILEALEVVMDEIVVTENDSQRAMPAAELAGVAEGVFGADRVHVQADLPAALEEAITLAESGDDITRAGVLVAGSVVTAGNARALLRRRGANRL
jgi:dihydrofolate synthase/folylpolyglutamate synthase